MTKFYLVIFLTLLFSCVEKEQYDIKLKAELAEILEKDQGYRELFGGNITDSRKNELLQKFDISEEQFKENERELFQANDSLNLLLIEKIIEKHGYPGKSMVGEPENEAAWFVIEHSDKIEKYFPIIEKAGENGELSAVKVAMMKDRMLMYSGKEQIYGSQGKAIFLTWPPQKQEDVKMIIWPLKSPEKVNQLRQEAGFENTVEENAKRMNIDYKVYTLKEVNEMNAQK
ncbi:DUF6624 domain-containing protein [Winogradskyella wichelsiae]|uniref:DUF6624 domain-containing protein n=1 Tax=Winogradskyella wichelsiae TaxID=2697007 RepID=UPI001860112C|nr:hypothetical protein H7F37_03620 [Winogradskyella sp. PAMC22761]QNK79077.1 hypothetical protein H7F37_04350 [Winogradskyella sp. PAMC22761]